MRPGQRPQPTDPIGSFPPRRFPIDATHVRTLIERDGPDCFYCGAKLALRPEDFEGPDWNRRPLPGLRGFCREHLLPVSRGGSDDVVNLVLACSDCNGSKGRRTPGEWLGSRDLCILVRSRTRHPELRAAGGLG